MDLLDFSSETYGFILLYGMSLPLRNVHKRANLMQSQLAD